MFNTDGFYRLLNMNNTRQEQILEAAIGAACAAAPLQREAIDYPRGLRARIDPEDATLQLIVGGLPVTYKVEIKPTLTDATLVRFYQTHKDHVGDWLLASKYVYPRLGQHMRKLGIQFIDTAGNVHINKPPALIFIQAHRRPADEFKTREDVFGAAGIRLVFALLCKEDLCNANYRTLAGAARVALGTVAGVMKNLAQEGHIATLADGTRQLRNRKALLDNWLPAYGRKLRPKTLLGTYAAPNAEFWKTADTAHTGVVWGGEIAGFQLTRYLKPEIATMYAQPPVNKVLLEFKLRKDERGPVEVRNKFWDFTTDQDVPGVVPPLLAYADLTLTGDHRNIETAAMVYDQYLRRHIERD